MFYEVKKTSGYFDGIPSTISVFFQNEEKAREHMYALCENVKQFCTDIAINEENNEGEELVSLVSWADGYSATIEFIPRAFADDFTN